MLRALRARIDRQGNIRLLEQIQLPKEKEALVIILEEEPEFPEGLIWSEFSLAMAMRGMEDEDTPVYTLDDLKVAFQ